MVIMSLKEVAKNVQSAMSAISVGRWLYAMPVETANAPDRIRIRS